MTDQIERFIIDVRCLHGMRSSVGGKWVRYSDYEKLEMQRREERDALLERVERGQKAEVERDQARKQVLEEVLSSPRWTVSRDLPDGIEPDSLGGLVKFADLIELLHPDQSKEAQDAKS